MISLPLHTHERVALWYRLLGELPVGLIRIFLKKTANFFALNEVQIG